LIDKNIKRQYVDGKLKSLIYFDENGVIVYKEVFLDNKINCIVDGKVMSTIEIYNEDQIYYFPPIKVDIMVDDNNL
jgi:hypothetical protein